MQARRWANRSARRDNQPIPGADGVSRPEPVNATSSHGNSREGSPERRRGRPRSHQWPRRTTRENNAGRNLPAAGDCHRSSGGMRSAAGRLSTLSLRSGSGAVVIWITTGTHGSPTGNTSACPSSGLQNCIHRQPWPASWTDCHPLWQRRATTHPERGDLLDWVQSSRRQGGGAWRMLPVVRASGSRHLVDDIVDCPASCITSVTWGI